MNGIEITAVISGLLNVFGAIAGLFGWKRQQKIAAAAEKVERIGEAVIQGVEACEKVLGSDEAKQVKRSVQTVARAAGVEPDLNGWLVDLGLADGKERER